jgi:hypothetical protein
MGRTGLGNTQTAWRKNEMTVNVKGRNIEIDDALAEEYTSMFAKELTERNIRCHIAIAYNRNVDDILERLDAEEISRAVSSAIAYEISVFKQ